MIVQVFYTLISRLKRRVQAWRKQRRNLRPVP